MPIGILVVIVLIKVGVRFAVLIVRSRVIIFMLLQIAVSVKPVHMVEGIIPLSP